jgi:uncharacterized membrane-anchored protein
MSTSRHTEETPAELGADVVEGAGVGLRTVELAVIVLLGLLATPPLLVMAVAIAVPAVAVAALVVVPVAVIAVPVKLVRRARAHHQEHGTTLFLHRLSW